MLHTILLVVLVIMLLIALTAVGEVARKVNVLEKHVDYFADCHKKHEGEIMEALIKLNTITDDIAKINSLVTDNNDDIKKVETRVINMNQLVDNCECKVITIKNELHEAKLLIADSKKFSEWLYNDRKVIKKGKAKPKTAKNQGSDGVTTQSPE